MPDPIGKAHLELAEALADAAGVVLRRYFRQPLAITDKDDKSPVTIADREAETAMRALIQARFPDHGILGEEHGTIRPDAEYFWVLDPIDGTKSFISGVPLFGTLIALLHKGRPVLGIIDQPILRERWVGVAGRPSTFNGQPIATRACADAGAATLFSTSPELFLGEDGDAFRRLQAEVKLTRFGTDCYAYALLASGYIDLVVEAMLKPYDFCALIPVIEGAGGMMTDWRGQELGIASDGRVLACGDRRLHAIASKILTG